MLITLTTDFGLSDHFVGTMKGVILGIAPRARIVDITHEIAPFALNEAAFVIAQAWQWFPKGTIHVVVVDPGVGSSRRPILVEAKGHRFIGPDNGIFSMIYAAVPHKAREITNAKLTLPQSREQNISRSRRFRARRRASRRGSPARTLRKAGSRSGPEFRTIARGRLANIAGAEVILKVDRFGNLITNLDIDAASGSPHRSPVRAAHRRGVHPQARQRLCGDRKSESCA